VALPEDGRSYLHFYHAYFWNPDNSDGGVLEFSLDGGSSWRDAGSLMEVNGYDGSIALGNANPLQGRQAFLNQGHGYIGTRLNLQDWAGYNIRFRWHMGLSNINTGKGLGWFIDDIRIHTCVQAINTATPTMRATIAPLTATPTHLPTSTRGQIDPHLTPSPPFTQSPLNQRLFLPLMAR
jgi:hypothetical protein